MAMTQQEIEELRNLRNEDQLLKDKIHMIESELMDVDMRMNFLMRSRHGKGWGLFFSVICFALSIAALVAYLLLYMDSAGTKLENYADTVVFSVTATMLPFLIGFVALFGITTTVLALFLIMDLYPSEGAYRSAVRFHRINIPHEKKVCLRQKAEMERSLVDLNKERNDFQNRLEELRNKEYEMLWN